MKIGIVNISGNIRNVVLALDKAGFNNIILVNDAECVEKSDILIFPGVSSFGETINLLHKKKLFSAIINHINQKKPYIGICLGFQILFSRSEESKNCLGFDIFQNDIKEIKLNEKNERFIKKINTGWRKIDFNNCKILNSFLTNGNNQNCFYFMHKYFLPVVAFDYFDEYSTISYGKNKICSHIVKDNIFAFQFHLERSGPAGIQLLKKIILHLRKKFKIL